MANPTIYTRAYSNSSAGRFVSGKGPKGDPLSHPVLLQDFWNHAHQWNREPTALVSASKRIIDTLQRAFNKHYDDGESPAEIWITFIEVPATRDEDTIRIHSAKALAEACKNPEFNDFDKFMYEVVFEWAIPEEWVVHEVSLQTLMNRGLQARPFQQVKTTAVRKYVARELEQQDPWEMGVTLGSFARVFGARAPIDWISHQLFHDCVTAIMLYSGVVKLKYDHGRIEFVDVHYLCDLEDGIDTSLYDCWLLDTGFLQDCEDFEEWRAATEDRMTWDYIEFWDTWHEVDSKGTIKELSAERQLQFDRAHKRLLVEYAKERASIRAKAVQIGL